MSGFSMGVTEVELVMESAKHSYRAFATVVLPDWGGNEVRIATSEFYDSGYESGVADTEERIIKLLEERHRPFQNPCNNARCKIEIHTDCVTCGDDYPCLFVDDIALIKGEK